MEGDLLDLLSPTWRILLLSDGSVTRHLRLLCPQLRQTRLECLRQGPIGMVSETSSSPPTSPRVALEGLPDDCELISGPMVQREVLLRISRGGSGDEDENERDGGRGAGGRGGGSDEEATTESKAGSGDDSDDDETGRSGGDGDGDVPMVYAASWWSRDTFEKYMTDSANPMWTNLRSQHVELYREIRRVYMGDNAELEKIFGRKGPFWGRHYIFWHQNRPMTVVYEVFNPMLEAQLGPAEPPAR